MTADRRADRRLARVHHASPYSQKTRNAKPSQSKKSSGWSLAGFFSYFNPLRSRHSEEPEEETEEETSQDELDTNQSSQSSHDVFGSRTQPTPPPPPPPPAARPPNSFVNGPSPPAGPSSSQLTTLPEPSASPLKNVDTVKTYLEQSGGRPLNQVEIAGLVSMLQDSIDNIDDDSQQPFRFSKSPSRAGSPATSSLFPIASSSTMSSTSTATPKTPTKPLTKNPNGTYKWQGAGSARRNRYHSPAFGSPSSGNKIKLPPAESAKSDSKRRRVGQDAETSSPQKTSASRRSSAEPTTAGPSTTSSTSAPNVKDMTANEPPQPKLPANGINTSTSRLNKPTAPAVSSPLRQAWSQDDLPSPNSSPTSAPKPSRAAAFMTELIREATPPKKPDIANPYQTASPVKTAKPSVKKPARKPRAVSKQPSTEEKQPEVSMQAIIEATLPRGSKRARPPGHLSTSTNGSSESSSVDFPSQSPSPPPKQPPFPSFQNGSSTTLNGSSTVTVEEVEDEEELPSPKKQKKAPAPIEPMIVEIDDPLPSSQPFLRPSEVIEPGDLPQLQTAGLNGASSSSQPTISPTTAGRSFFGLKSSAPKEPSKLRFSIKADRDETASSASSVSPTAATSPKNAKAEVLSIAISELPAETFTLPRRTIREGRSSGESRAEKEVRGFGDDDISMDDAWSLSSTSAGPSNLNKTGSGSSTSTLPASTLNPLSTSSTTTPSPAMNGGFNWDLAGMKPPSKQEDGWKCGTCDLMNPASAAEKCTVCDTPKPGVAKPVTPSFSMPKPPSTPLFFGTSSTTTVATNGTSSTGSGGFNWGAAGLKPPTTDAEGWRCGTCDLVNPTSATEKCTVCDTPKPGAEKSTTAPSFSMPRPPSTPLVFGSGSTPTTTTSTGSGSGGFNWGAAGLKPPMASTEGWKCGACDLMNPASAKEKCTVCETPKPGVTSSSSDSGNTFSMPIPPSGPLLFGNSTLPMPTGSGFSFGAPRPTGSAFNPSFTGFGPAPSTSTVATTATSSETGGFNWGAAGMKPLSESGGWKCETCQLMNSASATEKCTVCDAPKP